MWESGGLSVGRSHLESQRQDGVVHHLGEAEGDGQQHHQLAIHRGQHHPHVCAETRQIKIVKPLCQSCLLMYKWLKIESEPRVKNEKPTDT